jgi:hypothetical protein
LLKVSIFSLLALHLLSGCALSSLGAIIAGHLILAAPAPHVDVDIGETSPAKVYGNYGDDSGCWFDKELYRVLVTSLSAEASERVARSTATDACRQKGGKSMRVTDTSASRHGLAPIYWFEMKFRCDNEPNDLL